MFQNLMPNRRYFSTMALDLIFGPKCLFTQILEYHVFTVRFPTVPDGVPNMQKRFAKTFK